MTIRNALKTSSVIYVCVIIIVSIVLIHQLQSMHEAVFRMQLSSEITETVYQLQLLVYDQLDDPSLERITDQWNQLNEKLKSKLNKALDEESSNKRRINIMILEKQKAGAIFSSLLDHSANLPDQRSLLLGNILSNRLSLLQFESKKLKNYYQEQFLSIKRNSELSVGALAILTIIVLIFNIKWITLRVLSPLTQLINQCVTTGSQNIDRVVRLDSSDEFGDLAREFNSVISDLEKTCQERDIEIERRKGLETKLLDHKDFLEKTVFSRTEDLAKANKALKMEAEERELAQKSLVDYVSKLDKMNRELGRFSYIVSHHLQEPLRKIMSFGQLLEQKAVYISDEKIKRYISHMVDSSRRMKSLMEDLLLFINIDNTESVKEDIDPNLLVQKVLASLDREIRQSGARINVERLPRMWVDKKDMERAFFQLIDNALKFRRSERPVIRIWCEIQDNQWIIAIRDNGIGIESEYSEKIFEIFQRLHAMDKYTGTGVGLALCKKVVERNDGRIWVESSPDQGATFRFSVPMNNG